MGVLSNAKGQLRGIDGSVDEVDKVLNQYDGFSAASDTANQLRAAVELCLDQIHLLVG